MRARSHYRCQPRQRPILLQALSRPTRLWASLVSAVNRGKQAASSIDRYLGGDGQVIGPKPYKRELSKPVDETLAKRARMGMLPVCDRGVCFDEIEEGLTEEQMVHETSRCLRCDVLKVSRL